MINASQSSPKIDKLAQKELLEAYLTLEDKELLERAAQIEGIALIDFIIRSAREMARLALEENPPIKLNSEDSLAFAESLLNPPEPNERAIAAAAVYKKSMKELRNPVFSKNRVSEFSQ